VIFHMSLLYVDENVHRQYIINSFAWVSIKKYCLKFAFWLSDNMKTRYTIFPLFYNQIKKIRGTGHNGDIVL
jgi:hypothetical protein